MAGLAIGDFLGLRLQILALLTRFRVANDHRNEAMAGQVQPLSLRLTGTSGHTGPHQAASRECLLSSRSRVRVAVGAQMMQVDRRIRNHRRSNDVLLAGSHSHVIYRLADALAVGADQAGLGFWICGAELPDHMGSQAEILWRPLKPTHREPFPWSAHSVGQGLLRRCPGSQALAADTASSRVLAAGTAAAPGASCRLGEPCLPLRLAGAVLTERDQQPVTN